MWAYRFGAGLQPDPERARYGKILARSLYPNTQQGTSYTWNLQDVITAQSVVLAFPNSSLREMLTRVFSFMPLSLPLVIAWVLALAWRRGTRLEPYRVFVGALGFVLGLILTGVLIGYVTVWLACVLGFALAAGLSMLGFGRGFVLPVVLSALTPFTFLWVGNAGLLLGVIAVVIVLSVLPPDVLGSRFRRPITPPGQ